MALQPPKSGYVTSVGGLDRRRFLEGAAFLGGVAAAGGTLAGLGGCSVPDDTPVGPGGALRLGMAGGSTSDVLDPRTFLDWVPINIGYQLMNGLVEIDGDGNARPELLEEWESPAVTEWIFKVRADVAFHNEIGRAHV